MISNKNSSSICLSIASQTYKDSLDLVNACELAELRLDLQLFSSEELREILKSKTSIIATYREGKETAEERVNGLKRAIDYGANYVDIELESGSGFITEMISYARKNACQIIISYHNFSETPSPSKLQNIIGKARNLGADFVKVVCTFNSLEDERIIKNLYADNKNLIAFGMGELGKKSRVDCLEWGAKFTYVSARKGEETAAGQWTLDEMNEILRNEE